MKGFAASIFALASLVASVTAQAGAWQQCGGNNHSGPTTCVSGYYCKVTNEWYSQCVPGSDPGQPQQPTSTPTQPTTTPVQPGPTLITRTLTQPIPTATPTGGKQIRGVTAPVYHLYLQETADNIPVLGPEASSDRFDISGSIKNLRTGNYLNIQDASTSYKPLKFEATATTTGWGLEGDTIITTNGSKWGRQLNFLACASTGGTYQLYLQTGNDRPSGTCSMHTIHLPCLC